MTLSPPRFPATLPPSSGEQFADLGSGLGSVVLQVAATTRARRALGIELVGARAESARALRAAFLEALAEYEFDGRDGRRAARASAGGGAAGDDDDDDVDDDDDDDDAEGTFCNAFFKSPIRPSSRLSSSSSFVQIRSLFKGLF